MLILALVLFLIWLLVVHSVLLLVLAIIALAIGLFGNGRAYSGRGRYYW